MKRHARRAFNKLKKLKINVVDSKEYNECGDYRGHFWIGCEGGMRGEDHTELHVDYYSKFWGSDELNEILDAEGLYFEWYNAAYANVYDA